MWALFVSKYFYMIMVIICLCFIFQHSDDLNADLQ